MAAVALDGLSPTPQSKDAHITIDGVPSDQESGAASTGAGGDASDPVAAAAYKAEFLSSFSAKEEKRIMRKVDYRNVILFGLIYMIKQVSRLVPCQYIEWI